MIDEALSRKILTIGCKYNPPRGGIAKVIDSYSNLFSKFRFIETSRPGSNLIINLSLAIFSWIKCVFLFSFGGIKIVHIHGASNRSFWRKRVFIFTAKLFHKKIIYHIHGGEFGAFSLAHRKAVQKVFDNVDLIIVLSKIWKDFFETNFRAPNIAIVNNITDYPICLHEKSKNAVGVFLGLLGKNKGIFDILLMIKEHYAELRGKFTLYVGGNGDVEKVRDLINSYGIDDIVKFEGWVDGDRKKAILSESNIYILPSYNEGLPISILEAMSYGLAVISSNVGSIPEVVHNNENGFIVNPGDRNALFNALSLLINNSELRIKMGEASKKLVVPFYPENVERSLINIYKNLLSNNI